MSDMPNKTGIAWARVSTAGQDEKSQLPDIRKYAHEKGIDLTNTLTIKDASAFDGEQQVFQDRVIAAMKAGECQVLVSWAAVDRVERRGTKAAIRFLLAIEDAGGEWHITGHGRVTIDDIYGLLKLGMGSQQGHDESRIKIERIRIKYDAIESAIWPAGKTWTDPHGDRIGAFRGKAPFGYMISLWGGYKWLVPHPEESQFLKQAYEWALEGHSTYQIARWWEKAPDKASRKDGEGNLIPYKTSGKSAEVVSRTLQNIELYALGLYTVRRTRRADDDTKEDAGVYVHEVEPLIDFELAKRAAAAISARRTGSGPRIRHPEYEDYSGLFTCGNCENGTMYRNRNIPHNKKLYKTYMCKNCRYSINGFLADAEIERIMAADTARAYRQVWVPGISVEAERTKLNHEMETIGQRGLEFADMIAEAHRIKAALDALGEDVPGHYRMRDLGITKGEQWEIQTDHASKLVMARQWKWLGKRGNVLPAPGRRGSVIIQRLPKDESISDANAELLMRHATAEDPGFLAVTELHGSPGRRDV